jgi:hypothetical protein
VPKLSIGNVKCKAGTGGDNAMASGVHQAALESNRVVFWAGDSGMYFVRPPS